MGVLNEKRCNLVLSPKNLKYFSDNLYSCGFLSLRTSNLTFIIIPTCHIRLCVYFLFL